MAREPRYVDSYIRPYYTASGKWSKQTQFKPEVIQYCRGIQSSSSLSTLSNTMYSSKSAKVIIIGSPGVGKTSLLLRFCQDKFESNYKTTIGVDFEVEKCFVLGQSLNLQLWDTAGAERFKGVTTNYFRGANAIVLAFDLSVCHETLEKTREWLQEARDNCCCDFEVFLVGTKRDLVSDHVFETLEPLLKDYALQYDAELWITSANTGENVTDLFKRIAIISMETLILKELTNLRRIELAHQVVEKSSLSRIRVGDKKEKSITIKRHTNCCSR